MIKAKPGIIGVSIFYSTCLMHTKSFSFIPSFSFPPLRHHESTLHPLTPPGSGADDIVDAQEELCSLRGRADHSAFQLVRLDNTEFGHVANLIIEQVETRVAHTLVDGLAEAGNEI
jgi:hypothetical protein